MRAEKRPHINSFEALYRAGTTPRGVRIPDDHRHSRPDLYGAWLTYLRAYSRTVHSEEESRFIFINAWNEWGEGCYLEPDLRWGLAYLDETYRSKFYEGGLTQLVTSKSFERRFSKKLQK